MERKKIKECLKLRYEHSKSYSFVLFAAILTISYGTISNLETFLSSMFILLGLIFTVALLLFAFGVHLKIMSKSYRELIELTEK